MSTEILRQTNTKQISASSTFYQLILDGYSNDKLYSIHLSRTNYKYKECAEL